MWPNLQSPFTEEILNEKLHSLCGETERTFLNDKNNLDSNFSINEKDIHKIQWTDI